VRNSETHKKRKKKKIQKEEREDKPKKVGEKERIALKQREEKTHNRKIDKELKTGLKLRRL